MQHRPANTLDNFFIHVLIVFSFIKETFRSILLTISCPLCTINNDNNMEHIVPNPFDLAHENLTLTCTEYGSSSMDFKKIILKRSVAIHEVKFCWF